MRYQTEIKKWVKEVASSKDESDALRVRRLEEDMQRLPGTWRSVAALSNDSSGIEVL